jgi:hypothetical protein
MDSWRGRRSATNFAGPAKLVVPWDFRKTVSFAGKPCARGRGDDAVEREKQGDDRCDDRATWSGRPYPGTKHEVICGTAEAACQYSLEVARGSEFGFVANFSRGSV